MNNVVMKLIKDLLNRIGLSYVKMLCKREYRLQKFTDVNERPIEYHFVFKQLMRQWPKTVLDVGTGFTALPQLMRNCGFIVTAIDNVKDFWPKGMVNRYYHVINDDIRNTKLNSTFDFITCVSVLEHILDHNAAVRSMFSLLKSDGCLVLSFPYNEQGYVRNVYKLPCSAVSVEQPFITQAFSRKELDTWLNENNGEILEQEYWKFYDGEYWTCGNRIAPPVKVDRGDMHQISCVLVRKK